MGKCFFVSMVIHAILFGGVFFFLSRHPVVPSKNVERLLVQVEGVVSNKQAEEMTVKEEKPLEAPREVLEEEAPPIKETVEPEPKPKPKPKPKPRPKENKLPEKSVVKKIIPEEIKEEQPPPKIPAPGQGDFFQEAKRLQNTQVDPKEINRYLVQFKKTLSQNLSYPKEARKQEQNGVLTVRLSILADGSVPTESIAIVASSGLPLFDVAAIEAVKRSRPFPPPPRIMENIAVELSFNVK